MGVLLLAIAQGGATLHVAAPALLVNTALATLTCYLAAAALEWRAGTDDLVVLGTHGSLMLPGLTFLVGAASAVGLPGTWGWWAHRWLLDDLSRSAPWATPPLLAGSALLALGYLAPLAAFWRNGAKGQRESAPRRRWSALAPLAIPALVALPLLIFGAAPRLAWDSWLAPMQATLAPGEPPIAPRLPGQLTGLVYAVAAVGLVALPAAALRGHGRRTDTAGVEQAGVFAPLALGQSLRWLIWLATPASLFQALWDVLIGLSQAARRGLALFEQRYYLAGLMIALVIVIMHII
jgi:hypothetical protein